MVLSANKPHLARLKRAYNAWINSRGADPTLFIDLMAEDIQYVSGVESPGKPGYFVMHASRASMEEYFYTLHRDWEMQTYQTEEFLAQGNTVAVRGQCAFMFRATRKVCETVDMNWWHFEGDRAVALYHAFDTAAMIAATQR